MIKCLIGLFGALRVPTPTTTLTETGNLKKKKIIQVQGEIILQQGKVDTSQLCHAKLQYINNVCAKFQYNSSKTVVVCSTQLLVIFTHRDTQTDRLIPIYPPKILILQGIKKILLFR